MNLNQEEKQLPQCPFWRDVTGIRLGCEGLTDHSKILLQFDSPRYREQHADIFCCLHFRNCEIYRAIVEAKYAEEAI